MRHKLFVSITVVQTSICLSLFLHLLSYSMQDSYAIASVILQNGTITPVPTPTPFLGPIFYGVNYAIKSFDHDLPNGSEPDDGNDHVVHYDGSIHNAVTPTPAGDPYVPGIYGYDQHLGIDYNLKYQPVLAAAGGIVDYAGWTDPGNHTKGLGLHLILEHNDAYQTYYAHLSTLLYRTGDEIEVSSLNSLSRTAFGSRFC